MFIFEFRDNAVDPEQFSDTDGISAEGDWNRYFEQFSDTDLASLSGQVYIEGKTPPRISSERAVPVAAKTVVSNEFEISRDATTTTLEDHTLKTEPMPPDPNDLSFLHALPPEPDDLLEFEKTANSYRSPALIAAAALHAEGMQPMMPATAAPQHVAPTAAPINDATKMDTPPLEPMLASTKIVYDSLTPGVIPDIVEPNDQEVLATEPGISESMPTTDETLWQSKDLRLIEFDEGDVLDEDTEYIVVPEMETKTAILSAQQPTEGDVEAPAATPMVTKAVPAPETNRGGEGGSGEPPQNPPDAHEEPYEDDEGRLHVPNSYAESHRLQTETLAPQSTLGVFGGYTAMGQLHANVVDLTGFEGVPSTTTMPPIIGSFLTTSRPRADIEWNIYGYTQRLNLVTDWLTRRGLQVVSGNVSRSAPHGMIAMRINTDATAAQHEIVQLDPPTSEELEIGFYPSVDESGEAYREALGMDRDARIERFIEDTLTIRDENGNVIARAEQLDACALTLSEKPRNDELRGLAINAFKDRLASHVRDEDKGIDSRNWTSARLIIREMIGNWRDNVDDDRYIVVFQWPGTNQISYSYFGFGDVSKRAVNDILRFLRRPEGGLANELLHGRLTEDDEQINRETANAHDEIEPEAGTSEPENALRPVESEPESAQTSVLSSKKNKDNEDDARLGSRGRGFLLMNACSDITEVQITADGVYAICGTIRTTSPTNEQILEEDRQTMEDRAYMMRLREAADRQPEHVETIDQAEEVNPEDDLDGFLAAALAKADGGDYAAELEQWGEDPNAETDESSSEDV